MLKENHPEIFKVDASSKDLRRLMILLSPNKLELKDFDTEEAFIRINSQAMPLIPFSGEMIHRRLRENLEAFYGEES
ncbi:MULTISPECIES: hypothetical protein [unclassified Microcoleus]|uniref:hypothetical protein n=1 Tax=unclassified Microcoleus TaxID=2642155 RepID=UPI002FD17EE6